MPDSEETQQPRPSLSSRAEKIERLRELHSKNITVVPDTKTAPEVGDRMEDGTIYAGISPDTNEAMYAAPADEVMMNFNLAAARAEGLSRMAGKAYRVPSEGELNVLFNNRAAIGGFNETGSFSVSCYWSSTLDPDVDNFARIQRFSADGHRSYGSLCLTLPVRLVRS